MVRGAAGSSGTEFDLKKKGTIKHNGVFAIIMHNVVRYVPRLRSINYFGRCQLLDIPSINQFLNFSGISFCLLRVLKESLLTAEKMGHDSFFRGLQRGPRVCSKERCGILLDPIK